VCLLEDVDIFILDEETISVWILNFKSITKVAQT
jgi:hypothetical protein